jgi:ABC-type nitrate/sulfonate/bicarbonate transport system permease component
VARFARWGRAAQYLVVPVALVVGWQLAVTTGAVPRTLVAPPGTAVRALWDLTLDGTLTEHAVVSLRRIAFGFTIGTTVGVVVGSAIGASRIGARLFEPTALALIPVPAVAWIPLLLIVFGIGEQSKVVLVAIGSAATLVLATAAGVRSTSRNLVEVADLYEKGRPTLLWRVLLPSALPSIVAAARVAMALSWTLLVAAEVIASASGLGWFIWDARTFAHEDEMIAGMLAIGALGKATDAGIAAAGRYLTRWNHAFTA